MMLGVYNTSCFVLMAAHEKEKVIGLKSIKLSEEPTSPLIVRELFGICCIKNTSKIRFSPNMRKCNNKRPKLRGPFSLKTF